MNLFHTTSCVILRVLRYGLDVINFLVLNDETNIQRATYENVYNGEA